MRPWEKEGAHAATPARHPDLFIDQHVSPLFFRRTDDSPASRDCEDIISEEQFWGEGGEVVFGTVRLNGFSLTDWFPRAPGVYWSRHALQARVSVWSSGESNTDAELGRYFSPES